jgi:hypothetical protein
VLVHVDVGEADLEAQLQLGRRADALETARVIEALATGKAEIQAALRRLLTRFQLELAAEPAPGKP